MNLLSPFQMPPRSTASLVPGFIVFLQTPPQILPGLRRSNFERLSFSNVKLSFRLPPIPQKRPPVLTLTTRLSGTNLQNLPFAPRSHCRVPVYFTNPHRLIFPTPIFSFHGMLSVKSVFTESRCMIFRPLSPPYWGNLGLCIVLLIP